MAKRKKEESIEPTPLIYNREQDSLGDKVLTVENLIKHFKVKDFIEGKVFTMDAEQIKNIIIRTTGDAKNDDEQAKKIPPEEIEKILGRVIRLLQIDLNNHPEVDTYNVGWIDAGTTAPKILQDILHPVIPLSHITYLSLKQLNFITNIKVKLLLDLEEIYTVLPNPSNFPNVTSLDMREASPFMEFTAQYLIECCEQLHILQKVSITNFRSNKAEGEKALEILRASCPKLEITVGSTTYQGDSVIEETQTEQAFEEIEEDPDMEELHENIVDSIMNEGIIWRKSIQQSDPESTTWLGKTESDDDVAFDEEEQQDEEDSLASEGEEPQNNLNGAELRNVEAEQQGSDMKITGALNNDSE